MNTERVAKALSLLREEGLEVKLTPGAVFIRVARLDVACPSRNPRETSVHLDGKEIRDFLTAIEIRLAVGEVTTATIQLRMLP